MAREPNVTLVGLHGGIGIRHVGPQVVIPPRTLGLLEGPLHHLEDLGQTPTGSRMGDGPSDTRRHRDETNRWGNGLRTAGLERVI